MSYLDLAKQIEARLAVADVPTPHPPQPTRELRPGQSEFAEAVAAVADSSLADFERSNVLLEVRVRWWPETLWFVADAPDAVGAFAGPPFELPYSLDLPQADRDIWRLYDDLLASSNHTCSEVFRLAKAKDYEAVGEQIGRIGADVYLRTLMNIDSETRRWIDKILAGTA